MNDYDRSNFIRFLTEVPSHPKTGCDSVKDVKLSIDKDKLQNIIVAGMGGSAISADLMQSYTYDSLSIPLASNRDYGIPNYVNENTLFIAISYSGNTEETLTALQRAMERSATVVGISSGGELSKICEENNFPLIKVPDGSPPRQASGIIFFALLSLFEKIGLVPDQQKNIAETTELLKELTDRYNPEKSFGNNLANHIAQSIYHAIPVVYSGSTFLNSMPVRWRNQFNENSKSMAFSNTFPELNHNEIMGWEGLKDVNKHFRVIILRDSDESPRVQQRIKVTKEILRNKQILFGEVYTEGESRLARMFSLMCAVDWASYYWAMLNEVDPIKIDSIDLLKQKLSEAVA